MGESVGVRHRAGAGRNSEGPDDLSIDSADAEPHGPVAPTTEFSELWAYRETLRRRCLRLVGNASTAEDLVQDTYLRLLASGEQLERLPSGVPWLATVARRRSIDELRLRGRNAVVDASPEPLPATSGDPVEWAEHRDLLDRLRTAMAELRPRERDLLVRRVVHGASMVELAAEEATSVASVRSVLTRARRKVRGALERSGGLAAVPVRRGLVRRRLQRWAAQLDSSLPMATGVGVQAGQWVAAAVVAAMALLAGSTPVLPSASASTPWTPYAPASLSATTPVPSGAPARPGAPRPATSVEAMPSDPSALVPLPGVDVPDLRSDYAMQPDDAGIRSFAASADGRVILAGGTAVGGPVVYRSNDGGASWEDLPSVGYQGPHTLLVPPSFPADPRVFAVGGGMVQVSEDGGATFLKTFVLDGDGVLSPDFATGDERVFVAGPPLSSYRLSDPAPTPIPAIAPSTQAGGIAIGPLWGAAGELLVSAKVTGSEAALYSCTANGCAQLARLPGAERPPRLLSSRSRPGRVVAWSYNWFARSEDGGRNFVRRSLPYGLSVTGVHEGPTGSLYVTGGSIGAASGVFVSHDAGDTWLPIGAGSLVGRGATTVVALPGGRLLAGVLPHGGLACSVDRGATWARRCP
jgi:RNA polymerase sigma factor (sigma-70 family)